MDLEHHFIYYPSNRLVGTPKDAGLDYAEARFGAAGRLHGWFLPGRGPETILWLHGNAGNISHRLPWLALFRRNLAAHILIFDYAGYGLSRGAPSEASTYRDARDALAYLRTRRDVDPDRIVYLGKSLGGAVAVQLASEAPPYGLVVQSSFTSVPELARWHYPLLPAAWLLRTRYASIEKIGRVRAPALFVHGAADDVVPLEHTRRLYAAANEPKALLVVEGAGHNDLIEAASARYFETLRDFLATGAGAAAGGLRRQRRVPSSG